MYSFLHDVFHVCFCPYSHLYRIGVKVLNALVFFSSSCLSPGSVHSSGSIISLSSLLDTVRDRQSCGCIVLGSVSQQGIRRCSATESHTAVVRVAAQHFCLFTDREDGAVLVERTHCGAQTSAGGKIHLMAGMKSYSSGPLLMYIDVTDHSVRTNIYACSSGRGKKLLLFPRATNFLDILSFFPPPLQTNLRQRSRRQPCFDLLLFPMRRKITLIDGYSCTLIYCTILPIMTLTITTNRYW